MSGKVVRGRKLLVASVGVATVSYAAATGSLSACGGATSVGGSGSSSGSGDGGQDAIQVVGNLAPAACVSGELSACGDASDAAAYSCQRGEDPELLDPGTACTVQRADPTQTSAYLYCCVPWPTDGDTGCTPKDTLVTVCTTTGTYPFQCAGGANPSALDPSFTCGAPITDPTTAGAEDYCCTRP